MILSVYRCRVGTSTFDIHAETKTQAIQMIRASTGRHPDECSWIRYA